MPLGIENSQVSAWEFCFVERGVQPKWLVSATLNDHELERVKKLRSLSVAETDNAAEGRFGYAQRPKGEGRFGYAQRPRTKM